MAIDFFPLDLKDMNSRPEKPQHPAVDPLTSQATLLADEDDQDDEEEGDLRPGEKHAIYNTFDTLGTLPQQYDVVIKRAAHWCGVHDDYVAGVVERFERRLLRWWERRTDQGDDSETGSDAEDGGEPSEALAQVRAFIVRWQHRITHVLYTGRRATIGVMRQ